MRQESNSTLQVRGMTCGACVRHVKQALAQVNGVKEVEVQLPEGRVMVTHNSKEATVAVLIAALAQAGYAAEA